MAIHRWIAEVESEGLAYEGNVRNWCRLFKEDRTNVLDEESSGRLSLVTGNMKRKVNAEVRGTGSQNL
jgi:hypothetical protein